MEAAAAEEAAKKSKSTAFSANEVHPSASSQSAGMHLWKPLRRNHRRKGNRATDGTATPSSTTSTEASQKDWQELLSKSNKLSEEDRSRVERFFTEKFNPTPDQMTYKMKLNEERKTDPETGSTIKETLYLELDYSTFGYKKTRKTKKK